MTADPGRLGSGARLGRYTITATLGRGGMGTVYRATDSSLGRDVALKVLPPEVAADPDRLDRFRREARALAALNHPHIVTIYSVEQEGDVHFLTMELVPGQALDQVIAGQPVPIEKARQVAKAIADALAAAHDKGIIHRDLKPANIVLSESGQAKVLDFGLSKISATAPATSGMSATHLGTAIGYVLGTPAYMSPEQVSGSDVDERSDIFSLGVLLYEMVSGVRPFGGPSPAQLASSILRDRPTPVADLRPTTPADLSRVIARCLEKSPAARFASMTELRRALDADTASEISAAGGPSIAVLPFKNLSSDPDGEFFGDGLAEEILNALSSIDGLRVAARSSSFSFKGQHADVGEVASKLRVATVLDGSVRRSGGRIRVTVQLVDARNGFQLWSERYDREMADVFDVQDEIARAIAAKLKVTLTAGSTGRLVKAPTADVEAYELYLRGRGLVAMRGKSVAEGMECIKRAVERDPKFAAAWAALSEGYTVQGYWGAGRPDQTLSKSLTAARRAVRLDPELGDAYCALGGALLLWERDYEAAGAAFARGLELNPGHTQGRCWYGLFWHHWIGGRGKEGVAEVRRAFAADPLSPYAAALMALALAPNRDTTEAVRYGRLAVERAPTALLSSWALGLALHWDGQLDEAIVLLEAANGLANRAAFALSYAACAYADAGRTSEARAIYQEILDQRARTYVDNGSIALAALSAGDVDAFVEYGHQSCDEREATLLITWRVRPGVERVLSNPRFAELARRMRVAGTAPERGRGE
jgi:serine/threonine protein kinase/tetratricopeptide (TPR) repeat protein